MTCKIVAVLFAFHFWNASDFTSISPTAQVQAFHAFQSIVMELPAAASWIPDRKAGCFDVSFISLYGKNSPRLPTLRLYHRKASANPLIYERPFCFRSDHIWIGNSATTIFLQICCSKSLNDPKKCVFHIVQIPFVILKAFCNMFHLSQCRPE